ncbi:MAG: phenylacetate--CoA ligase family protein [Oligoflexia bacterium]|nr:phenylacetate--CoA ligase family protein [Oligoflexia bacterium]MBF0366431.1 phenylacetate--CoA ligase family protein [Oligoflexia bacterium]
MIYSLQEIVLHAKNCSPYYRKLYAGIGEHFSLEDLPIVTQEDFWEHNSIQNNRLLTGPIEDGVVFKSGGTTGRPKFSVFTKAEWERFTAEFAYGMDHLALENGDRVANLFYGGSMYASFVFIMKSLEKCHQRLLHFPISGQCPLEDTIAFIRDYDIRVLLGVPTSIITLISKASAMEVKLPLTKIFFGGESMYPDQREFIKSYFPKILISSIGHASVDGGHIGLATPLCSYNEHVEFCKSSILEIIDPDSGQPIINSRKRGRLVYTNLTRKLMPIIRYPVGDMAEWTSESSEGERKYRILGRDDAGARVGTVTLTRDDLEQVFAAFKFTHKQMLLERIAGKDALTIRVVGSTTTSKEQLLQHLYKERSHLLAEVKKGHINPPIIEIVNESDLEVNPRTGKLRLVIDRR